jgi:hypothetical protein
MFGVSDDRAYIKEEVMTEVMTDSAPIEIRKQFQSDSWDMSQERAFMENLFCQRFNFFIVIFSLVIAGAASANTQKKLSAILLIGSALCLLVALTIYRIYAKLIWILKALHRNEGHPVAVSSKGMKEERGFWGLPFGVNWIIGFLIPLLCCAVLLYGSYLSITGTLTAADSPIPTTSQRERIVTKHASGTFEVKMSPQAPEDNVGDPTVGRMSLDKQFHGDLEAASKGQMLAVASDVQGSAGYVAMERVNGTLHGHKGTFALQHSGTMTRGAPQLSITVVPDSGTGEFVGLAGKMTNNIVDGKHFYEFEYTLAQSQ